MVLAVGASAAPNRYLPVQYRPRDHPTGSKRAWKKRRSLGS